MKYTVEVFDNGGRRVAWFDEVPLMDAIRNTPDRPDIIRGLLPRQTPSLGPGHRVRAGVAGNVFCEAIITSVAPEWSDTRKLILDKYIPFHEVIAFEAQAAKEGFNPLVSRQFAHRGIAAIVKDLINRAPGRVHYGIPHEAYPAGAQREYEKFAARKCPENELGAGGVAYGQWVGTPRLDASSAFAKDGDTISGLSVDGADWPDVRLMMIDAEEMSRNARAVRRHPEVADWTDAQYAASAYGRRAAAARRFLQHLIDTRGIDYVELNPHRNTEGVFDDRVDAYGRYVGLIYGQGQCFNAALIECGHGDVYLYEEGRYLPPELHLKDYFSYPGVSRDSVQDPGMALVQYDPVGGLLEAIAGLAYMAGGYVFTVGWDGTVHLRNAASRDRVVWFDARRMGARIGSDSQTLCNALTLIADPRRGLVSETYARAESIGEYGVRPETLACFAVGSPLDAARLAEGLLRDLAYPAFDGAITFFDGDADWHVGDLVEIRGTPVRRLDRALPGEWGGAFPGRLAGRVHEVRHRFSGKHVSTTVVLGSPQRSVTNPIHYLMAGQPAAFELTAFRLDDNTVGVDMGFHLN